MDLWFYGLADAHGVESFVEDIDAMASDLFLSDADNKARASQQFAMCLRAQANQQRHAVAYRVLINDKDAEVIEALIKEGKFAEALNEIKARNKEVFLGTYGTTKKAAEKNWNMIPNPDLDPYHN